MVTTLATRSILRAVGTAPALRPMAIAPVALRRWATTTTSSTAAATQSMTPQENVAFLNAQRLQRPNSPHMTIYQPQITWYLSIFNRITGVGLSGALYAGSLLYLFHPIFPVLDSTHLVQLATDMSPWLKGSVKMLFAVPFTFHTFNGIRHLAWDTGFGLTLKGVYVGGYSVLAATAISSIYLAFFV